MFYEMTEREDLRIVGVTGFAIGFGGGPLVGASLVELLFRDDGEGRTRIESRSPPWARKIEAQTWRQVTVRAPAAPQPPHFIAAVDTVARRLFEYRATMTCTGVPRVIAASNCRCYSGWARVERTGWRRSFSPGGSRRGRRCAGRS
jgi:hypothetical protein